MKKRLASLLATTFVLGLFAVPGTASASCTKLIEEQSDCTETYACRAAALVLKSVDCVE